MEFLIALDCVNPSQAFSVGGERPRSLRRGDVATLDFDPEFMSDDEEQFIRSCKPILLEHTPENVAKVRAAAEAERAYWAARTDSDGNLVGFRGTAATRKERR